MSPTRNEMPVQEPDVRNKNFDEVALQELSDSIKEHGVFQPIIVKRKDGKIDRTIDIDNMDESYCKDLKDLVKEMIIENEEKRINYQKAYYKILQIDNSIIIHSPNFNPTKYLDHIGTQLSDFEEIKHNQKNYYILGAGYFGHTEKMKSKKNNKIYAIKSFLQK